MKAQEGVEVQQYSFFLYEIMGKKYCRAGQATDGNMANVHCMLGTKVYKHTLRICNTYCFSTGAMFSRRPLNVTLYIYCLSCYLVMEETLFSVRYNLKANFCDCQASVFNITMQWFPNCAPQITRDLRQFPWGSVDTSQ
jgi:hypothetical protein